MMQLSCIVSRDPDAIQLLMVKLKADISVVPVWKEKPSAEDYLIKNNYGGEYAVKDFTLKLFDECREWAKTSGIQLFIHLVD